MALEALGAWTMDMAMAVAVALSADWAMAVALVVMEALATALATEATDMATVTHFPMEDIDSPTSTEGLT